MPPASSSLISRFEEKKRRAEKEFATRHEFAENWLKSRGVTLDVLREHSAKLLTGATIGSVLLLTSPKMPLIGQTEISHAVKQHASLESFLSRLKTLSPNLLSPATEAEIIQNIQDMYGVSAAFELDSHRLKDYTGLMGLEQHLYRSEADTLGAHDEFQVAGIAPARGAFGYFAEEGKSWERAVEEEKYYIVLQTFLFPNWETQWTRLKPWYKFRKFLVINPDTGKAVVAVLGDSGPGVTTGKVFGGSPEVMHELGFYPGKTKGNTLILFIDDPSGTIPLGPVSFQGETHE